MRRTKLPLRRSAAALAAALSLTALSQAGPGKFPPPVIFKGGGDHRNMMEQLGIKALRPGADPNNQDAFDEAKADPYPPPELLLMKNGRRVTNARQWEARRAELLEDFEREVYGRVPRNVPRVKWEVTNTSRAEVGGRPAVTKTLVGHVDNSSYPPIKVDIEASLTTPAEARAGAGHGRIRLGLQAAGSPGLPALAADAS